MDTNTKTWSKSNVSPECTKSVNMMMAMVTILFLGMDPHSILRKLIKKKT